MRNLLIGAFLGFAMICTSCKDVTLPTGKTGGGPSGTPSKNGGTISGTVDAVDLCKDYKAGESTADGKYKGKELTVKGTIESVRPKTLTLKGESTTTSVRCEFADELSKLNKGDSVKVKGTCDGKQGTGDGFSVNLKNCKLEK